MRPLVSMREALSDPHLLGSAMPGESWQAWRVLLIAAFGEPLTEEERTIFASVTGRAQEPLEPVEELWGILGRRSGKTRAAGVAAAYCAGLCDHGDYLAPGERGVLPILAANTTQADRAFMHAVGVIEHSPLLSAALASPPTADTIRLNTRVDIQVRPANFRTIRGITAVAAVADEVAFWSLEGSANPDAEILNALRPALATTGGPLFLISSPHAKRGEVYEAYRRYYGPNGDPRVLVAKAPSRTFNPTLPQSVVDRAYQRDAAVAAAEFGAVFRADLEAFVSREVVEACVSPDVDERLPKSGVTYRAFVDPSGGSSDAMTLAIAHQAGEKVIVDAVRERKPPFSPEAVVAEFAALLQAYGVPTVTGDRYGGLWPRERFEVHGVSYQLAEQTRSDLYRDLLPMLNGRRVDLLDLPKLVAQITGLERRVSRGGRESIDHKPGAHDDVANAVAGAVALVGRQSKPFEWVVNGRRISATGDERESAAPVAAETNQLAFAAPDPEAFARAHGF